MRRREFLGILGGNGVADSRDPYHGLSIGTLFDSEPMEPKAIRYFDRYR